MRIGVDARILGRRGVGRYLKNLMQAIAAQKQPHEFILFLGPKSDRLALPNSPAFRTHQLEGKHPAWLEQLEIPRLARQMGLDLLHFADNTGPLRCSIPVVLTQHDDMWRRPISQAIPKPSFSQRLQAIYRRRVCPLAAKNAARVITVSRYSKEQLCRFIGLAESKVRVIGEGVDPVFTKNLAAGKAGQLVKKLGVQEPFLLCSGAADRRKNVDGILEALALASQKSSLLRKASLVVTSLRPAELENTNYVATAKRLGLIERVRFLGYVEDEELKALYQKALAFVFPSLWEGFGLPVLEAFAMACPVLSSNTTSLPEVAGKAAVLVDPVSPPSIASGLLEITRPGVAADLKRAGKAQLKNFSWVKAALQTLEVYEEALNFRQPA